MGFLFAPTPYGNNSDLGPSASIWHDLPDNIQDPNIGAFYNWKPSILNSGDFPTSAAGIQWGGWSAYGDTGATIVSAGVQGGALSLASDGDNEQCSLQNLCAAIKPATSTKKIWFEARIAKSTITDVKHNTFVGLMNSQAAAAGAPVSTSDALVDKNLMGFWCCGSNSTGNGAFIRFVYKKTGQTAQMLTSAGIAAIDTTNITTSVITSFVAATYIKLGFVWDPIALSSQAISVYVNGVPYTSAYITQTNMGAATFPSDLYLSPVFGIMNATGSTPGNSSIADLKCAQLN